MKGPPAMFPGARYAPHRRPNAGRAPGTRAGFTLVEISIAILVLSILFTIMFGIYFGINRIITQSAPSALARKNALLALEMMRSSINQTYFHRDLERIVFVGKREGGGETHTDRLTFAAVHPGAESVGAPAVREVSFYLEEERDTGYNETTYTLFRREDQMVDDEPGEGGAHYPVLKHVVSLQLKYSLSGRDWRDDWNSKETRRIPRLIQIQLRVKIGSNTQKFETLAYTGLLMR